MQNLSPPIYLLDTKWTVAKQVRDVPAWAGHVEVVRLEFDADTGAGIVHLTAQPGAVWTVKLTLISFLRMVNLGAFAPAV